MLDETVYTQPALFALEYALVRDVAVVGRRADRSSWATASARTSPPASPASSASKTGLKLIAARGRLMQALSRDGEMYAVFADEATVRDALAPVAHAVSVAAVNAPGNVTVSGRRAGGSRAHCPVRA